MKIRFLSVIVFVVSILYVSCDDTTDMIGTSLTDNSDLLEVETASFSVSSESFVADSVLSRNVTGYLGKIRDPETGNYITGNFMAQFGTLEDYTLPEKDSIVSLDKDNEVVADSCSIRLFYQSFYGDSLATMNLTAHEMSKPMEEGVLYYSNFDLKERGYVNNDGMKINKTYTLTDLSVSEDEREDASSYTPNIKIDLNKEYVDKDGKRYNNYGTYIMRKYYENPQYFKNSYNFIHDVCPGFYFEMNDGLGSMAYISVSQLNVYFRYKADTIYVGTSTFSGTEEVLQTTNIVNDDKALEALANDYSCTYLKTPSGIFTELELPVEDVKLGHENDTLNTAKLTLTRINDDYQGDNSLDVPSTLLLIPSDSLYRFYENEDIVDYQGSFIASYDSKYNNYVFSNISGLITSMYNKMQAGKKNDANWIDDEKNKNWNKVVLIPVTITTNSSGTITKVVHDMGLTSTRLVRGTRDNDGVKLDVVYSKFKH